MCLALIFCEACNISLSFKLYTRNVLFGKKVQTTLNISSHSFATWSKPFTCFCVFCVVGLFYSWLYSVLCPYFVFVVFLLVMVWYCSYGTDSQPIYVIQSYIPQTNSMKGHIYIFLCTKASPGVHNSLSLSLYFRSLAIYIYMTAVAQNSSKYRERHNTLAYLQ